MPELNYAAVFVAALTFFVGGLWYSPALFCSVWLREDGRAAEPKQRHPARVFATSFLFSLIAAFSFAVVLGPDPGLGRAIGLGALTGAGVVASSFGINYQFAGRSALLWLIDGGYHTLQFTLIGLVLGLCH
jgi:hypothetical protein